MKCELPWKEKDFKNKLHMLTTEALSFIDRFYRAPAGFIILDEQGVILDCNRDFATRLKKHPAQLRETFFIDHICDRYREDYIHALHAARDTGSSAGCPILFMRTGQDHFNSYMTVMRQCCNRNPESVEYRVIVVDNFQTDLVEAAVKREKEKANLYFDIAGVIMIVINENEIVSEINRKGEEVFECPRDMIVGKNWFDTFLPLKIRENTRCNFNKLISGELAGTEYFENSIITLTGKEKIIAWHNAIMRNETGAIYATLSSGIDISLQRKVETQLRINATIDHLTGVLNRREGFMMLESIIEKSCSERKPVTICLLDLNNLKYINDAFGHLEGDIVIMQTARLISRNIKRNDVVFRLGGDEFLIIFQKCNLEIAEFILERLKLSFDKHNATSGKTFNISWCAGIAEWNDQKMDTIENLIHAADRKMYQQKKEFYALTKKPR